ncbi:Ribonuclease 3-like protein 2 [Heracleum sosnowskyi]|uniref:Ribonuclease 3-like protein 2 n=1 Tax=Heracleum sosnowskyi TaxID=360622 RepID=A0AAD8JDB7_9APIA|nr:Ribonuclease 3-like protein 2 [Heracleum sosnowskyi]
MFENQDKDCMDIDDGVKAVEEMLDYKFTDKKLLEKALTHPSYTNSALQSYERLEFVGDAVLGSMIASYVYLTYPDHEPGHLSLITSANVSTENLARVAVRNGLFKYLRHRAVPSMVDKVKEFLEAVNEEDHTVLHGGVMRAPKVLADIVESVVAAVFVDLQFDLKATWTVVTRLFQPLVSLQMLEQQPQPITMLFELCQKNGQQVEFKQWREDDKNFSSVYVDSKFIVSESSDSKENAKLHAAMAALKKLEHQTGKIDVYSSWFENGEIVTPKRKLNEICLKKKWSKPTYRIEKEAGPDHAKIYVSSVSLKIGNDIFCKEGEQKFRLKDAEGCAAQAMLLDLRHKNYF